METSPPTRVPGLQVLEQQTGRPSIVPADGNDQDQPSDGDNIKVIVRVRPPNDRETSAANRRIVNIDKSTNSVHLLGDPQRTFTFDGVVGEDSSQQEVFDLVGREVGESCINGYNGSIYVYGQTGVGKTYTMCGPVTSIQSMHSDSRRGIMCRILDVIFTQVNVSRMQNDSLTYLCKCSYLEIYKESITDLLEPSNTNLQIREDMNRGVYVERLSENTVWNLSDAFHVLWKGLHQRHVGATQMNELSSRSHAVFTLAIESTTTAAGVTSTRVARLNLIDLAGSERQNYDPSTQNDPAQESLRVKEAGAINKSLSALTNVIMSLSRASSSKRRSSSGGERGNRRPFVHFRDSKLTFLLKDSLGGNSKTSIVANISPSALCFGETLSTLKFAARAKHIQCAAVMNEEYSGTVESLTLEVKSLKAQLELLSSRGLMSSQSQISLTDPQAGSSSKGDDDEEEMADDELRALYSHRRVRRLEILLALALERERKCDLKRHKLEKCVQFLEGLHFRKDQYFDALKGYYSLLTNRLSSEAARDRADTVPHDLAEKLLSFQQLLTSLPADSCQSFSTVDISARAAELGNESEQPSLPGGPDRTPTRQALTEHEHDARGSSSQLTSDAGGQRAGMARGRKRGTSQSLQRTPSGRALQQATIGGAGGNGGAAADSASTVSTLATLADSPDRQQSGGNGQGAVNPGLADEACFLREENRLLRRQLENHPELHRLGVENRMLREQLSTVVNRHAAVREEVAGPARRRKMSQSETDSPESKDTIGGKTGERGLTRDRSLTRTSRSSFLGHGVASKSNKAADPPGSPPKTTLSSVLSKDGAGWGKQKASSGKQSSQFPGIEATQISPSNSDDSDSSDGGVGSPSRGAEMKREDQSILKGPWISRSQEFDDVDEDSRTRIHFQRMAREVEELLRAKGSLEEKVRQFRKSGKLAALKDGPMTSPTGQASLSNSPAPTKVAHEPRLGGPEPRLLDELLASTHEALALAESISESKGDALMLHPRNSTTGNEPHEEKAERDGLDEKDVYSSLMKSISSGVASLQKNQRLAASAPHLATQIPRSSSNALQPSQSGGHFSGLTRNKSMMALHRITEGPLEEVKTPRSATRAETQIEVIGNSAASSPAASGSDILKEAVNQIKQLHRHLDLVNTAYNDVYEQFNPLREEYERRLEECRFFELQCHRLDMHCQVLEDQLKRCGSDPLRPLDESQARRCLSLSSLRDSKFWEQRFKSLSALTSGQGIGSPPKPHQGTPAQPSKELTGSTCDGGGPTGTPSIAAAIAAMEAEHGRVVSATSSPVRGDFADDTIEDFRDGRAQEAVQYAQYVRRVSSAPVLPGCDNVLADHSQGSGIAVNSDGPSPHGVYGNQQRGAKDVTFDRSTFLSLAKRPGDKSAALQYLMQSTNQALSSSGSSGSPSANDNAASSSVKQRNTIGGSGAYASLSQSLSQQELRTSSMTGTRNAGQPHPQQQHGKRGVLSKSNSAQSVGTRVAPARDQLRGFPGSSSPRDTISHVPPGNGMPYFTPPLRAAGQTPTTSPPPRQQQSHSTQRLRVGQQPPMVAYAPRSATAAPFRLSS